MRPPSTLIRFVFAVFMLALGVGAVGLARDRSADDARSGHRRASFTFRVETPPLVVSAEPDGSAAIDIDGFTTRPGRYGAPDVPYKTVLVAIPEGATPRLEVRYPGVRAYRNVRPRPVPREVFDLSHDETPDLRELELRREDPLSIPRKQSFLEDPSLFDEPGAVTPTEVAWMSKPGVLREQRFVPVNIAPVRYAAGTGGLVIESIVEITVHFDGVHVPLASSFVAPSRFESIYRETFENYGQGRSFRIAPPSVRPAPPRAAATSSGPGTPLRRILVDTDGPVRLDYSFLALEAPELLAHDPATWQLTNRGEQVPLHIHQVGVDPAALEPGEWVQFHGQALEDEPTSVLNFDSATDEDLYEVRDFTDTNAYFLTVDASAQPAMTERDATPDNVTPESSFTDVVRLETDDLFRPWPEFDIWYAAPVLGELASRTDSVSLPGLFDGTLPVQFRAAVRGLGSCRIPETPDHESHVSVMNDLGQTLVLPASNPDNVGNTNVGIFDGNTVYTHVFDWTHSGGNPEVTDPLDIRLFAPAVPGGCSDPGGTILNELALDYLEVQYTRAFQADGDRLVFSWPDGDAEFEITGFNSSAPEIYEITGSLNGSGVVDAVRLTGATMTPDASLTTVRFHVDNDPGLADGTPRTFVVAGDGGVKLPSAPEFLEDRVSELLTDTTQADLVVVVHPDVVSSVCSMGGNSCSYDADCTAGGSDVCELDATCKLAELLALRASEGITSRVVRIQDVEDEFNQGLPGPLAIRNMATWLLAGGWGTPTPAYLMLVGDGSYDYEGGTAEGNFVPTQLMLKQNDILSYFSADNLLAAVAGDDSLADLVVGRLSTRTVAETEDVASKILDYDAEPDGPWISRALFVSDRGKQFDDFEATEFERINDIAKDKLTSEPYSAINIRYWSDFCVPFPPFGGCPLAAPDNARQAIKDAMSPVGAIMAQYAGHGNFDLWSDDVILCANELSPFCFADDTPDLLNGPRAPWLLVHNCLSGGFHTPAEKTLGEQWFKNPFGGAVAVFAPSGLGFRFIGETVTESIWEDVFGPMKERTVAVPIMNALAQLCAANVLSSVEACQFYTLIGDPTLTLRLPTVDPAKTLAATLSTGVDPFVDLTWDPSDTVGAMYDVYRRKTAGSFPYVKINDAPWAMTSYHDEGVVHTLNYAYYVVATENGFHSAWSNFNSDCDVSGPDCVQARPLNMTPPTPPINLSITDPETGSALLLDWEPNFEPDIDFYEVHFGLTPALGDSVVVGYGSSFTLSGLENNTPYYMAVTATNTSELTSALSELKIATPIRVLGVRAPGFVDDLVLGKTGTSTLLGWGAISADIYGKPEGLVQYEVFRGSTVQFLPALEDRISLTGSTFAIDSGALEGGEPDYVYLVRAVDADGNPGGLGRQLPDGIIDLILEPSANAGKALLSWNPVTVDFDGGSTSISRYEVYAADEPISRANIREFVETGSSGTIELIAPAVVGTSLEIDLPAGDRYYSVLAVDNRGNRSPF